MNFGTAGAIGAVPIGLSSKLNASVAEENGGGSPPSGEAMIAEEDQSGGGARLGQRSLQKREFIMMRMIPCSIYLCVVSIYHL